MYPVELAYLKEPTADYVRTAADTAWQINMQVCYPKNAYRIITYLGNSMAWATFLFS
jgi:hypothetical protein